MRRKSLFSSLWRCLSAVVSDALWVQVKIGESVVKPMKERMLLFMIFGLEMVPM
jgi:hypothetical protein